MLNAPAAAPVVQSEPINYHADIAILQTQVNEWRNKYYEESEKYKACLERVSTQPTILNLTGIGIKKQKSTKDV